MFGNRPPEGYCRGSEVGAHLHTALDEDDVTDDEVFYPNSQLASSNYVTVLNGKAKLGFIIIIQL